MTRYTVEQLSAKARIRLIVFEAMIEKKNLDRMKHNGYEKGVNSSGRTK